MFVAISARKALETVASTALTGLMAIILIPLGLPAALIVSWPVRNCRDQLDLVDLI